MYTYIKYAFMSLNRTHILIHQIYIHHEGCGPQIYSEGRVGES